MDNNEELVRLVDRAKNGDQEAFTDLYNSSYKMVYLTCMSHLKNNEDAEDAAQEVFINVYNKLNMLTDNRTFYGWVKTIAVHTSLNKIAARKGNISYDDAIESGENLDGSDDLEMLPDSVIFEEEKRKIMMNIISASLSEVQYQTVVMYYYDELPIGQISQILNCPVPTIKKRLKVARIKIREGIEDYEHKTGDKLCAAAAIPSLGMLFKSTFGVPSVGAIGASAPIAAASTSAQQPRAPHDTSDNQPVKGNGQPSKAGASQASKASKAGKVVASTAKKGLGIKIAATAAAVAVVGTGTVVAVNLLSDDVKPFDPDKTYEVGDSFTMGSIDGEDLTWKVIDENNDNFFVILDSNLEERVFDEDSAAWVNSDLHKYLNTEFYDDAFDRHETKYIRLTMNQDTTTVDSIFALSAEEVEDLLDDDTIAIGSEYWLRTPSEDGTQVAAVDEDGEIIFVDVDEELAVRPAMWVGVESEEPIVETTAPVIETEPEVEEIYYNIGDNIDFGTYNGAVLNWRILDNQDGHCLLVLNDFIGYTEYWNEAFYSEHNYPNFSGETLYLDSNVRALLVGDFYDNAFTEEEKAKIVCHEMSVENYTDLGPGDYGTFGDSVFLLSTDEAQRYFSSDEDRDLNAGSEGEYSSWWLRTPAEYGDSGLCTQAYVTSNGSISSTVRVTSGGDPYNYGIRPAMWVNLGPAAPAPSAPSIEEIPAETEQASVDRSIYDPFLNGEARVDVNDLVIRGWSGSLTPSDIGYTLPELIAQFDTLYFSSEAWYSPNLSYAYIDCGLDGYPELLLKYTGVGIYDRVPDNNDDLQIIITAVDGGYKAVYGIESWARCGQSYSYSGVTSGFGSGGAATHYVWEGFVNGQGDYIPVEDTCYEGMLDSLRDYGSGDEQLVATYLLDNGIYEEVVTTIVGDSDVTYVQLPDEYIAGASAATGVHIYSYDEVNQMINDYLASVGCPDPMWDTEIEWIPYS